MSSEINVLALVKGGERYVFLYDDDNRSEALRQLGRYASNPDLSFTWYDAAVLSQKMRRDMAQAENQEESQAAIAEVHINDEVHVEDVKLVENRPRFTLPAHSDEFEPDELP